MSNYSYERAEIVRQLESLPIMPDAVALLFDHERRHDYPEWQPQVDLVRGLESRLIELDDLINAETAGGRIAMPATPKLYTVYTKAPNWTEPGNTVTFHWFVHERPNGPPAPYADTIIDWQPGAVDEHNLDTFRYEQGYIDEQFTHAEAEQLVAWLTLHQFPGVHEIVEEELPVSRRMGVGAQAVGGETAFYMLSKSEGYDLPVRVWGFYRKWGDRDEADSPSFDELPPHDDEFDPPARYKGAKPAITIYGDGYIAIHGNLTTKQALNLLRNARRDVKSFADYRELPATLPDGDDIPF